MKLVLLSGGSGKRLWPMSNDSRSKQFLRVLSNEQGQPESMIQRIWRQLDRVGLSQSVVISTSKSQKDILQSQLNINSQLYIVEPERRDTFPAISLAVSYLFSVMKLHRNETIAVLPVDHYVDDQYFHKIKELEHVLEISEANLALLGVTPNFPSEKYGYIVPMENPDNKKYFSVSHFIEKPNKTKAAELIEKNALWNCGVFCFKLGYLVDLLEKKGFPVQYEELLEVYAKLPKISFDYEVVEKTSKIVVVPYDGNWKDLGTWNTLTEQMDSPILGKGKLGDDCYNTHLINELDIPVVVLGISNAIVAVSPDGILVSDKMKSHKVKDLDISSNLRTMYEERRWGWYRILDFARYDDREVLTRRICIKQGSNLSYHYHKNRTESWTILHGEGEIIINGNRRKIISGDAIQVPPYCKHAIRAITDLEIIEVQSGCQLVEEDIIRLTLSWDEILESHLISGGCK